MKPFLKLAVAALLYFFAVPLYAAEPLHDAPVQTMGFTDPDQGLPFRTSMDMTRDAASDGSLTFSLDLLYGTDTQPVRVVKPMIHYNSKKLEVINISNIAHAGISMPDPQSLLTYSYGRGAQPPLIANGTKPMRANTDTRILLAWLDIDRIRAVADATLRNPVRVATLTFKWKPGATGNDHIFITEFATEAEHEGFYGTGITLQGAAQAKIAANTENIDITAGTVSVRVECALSRSISTEATCTLGRGGNAVPGESGDYTADPAINDATITIDQGELSHSHTFKIKPNGSNSNSSTGKTIEIAIKKASDANDATITHDPEPARILLDAPGLDVSQTSVTSEGETVITTGDQVSTEVREDGGTAIFQVRLVVPPRGGEVVVAISSTDTSEAMVSPASLTFTATDWNKKKDVTISGVDDGFVDGDKKHVISFVVDSVNTKALHYHGVTASVSGTTIDTNVAKATLTIAPEYLREADSEQHIVITAKLGGARFESDTQITLSKKEGGTAIEGEDYEPFGLPNNFSIPTGESSATLTFSIRTKADKLNDEKETILIIGAFAPPALGTFEMKLTILEFDLDVDNDGSFTGRDGILVMRHLMGVEDTPLIAGQTSAAHGHVIAHIERCEGLLNVSDEGGKGDADWVDGALIVRYLLGIRGEDLLRGLPIKNPIPTSDMESNIARFLP